MYVLRKETGILVFSVLVEIYRVFTGCLMVVFLPGKCNDHRCNPVENFLFRDTIFRIGYYMNVQSFAVMALLYSMEIQRENRLRKYLWFNTHHALDSESIGTALNNLPDIRKQGLLTLQKRYRSIVCVSYVAYSLNTILSAFLIGREYLDVESDIDERALLAFLTSVLFLGAKLYDTSTIVFVSENIFYSAYTKKHLQFNDVEAKKKKVLTSRQEI
jgi:hypothetical protein